MDRGEMRSQSDAPDLYAFGWLKMTTYGSNIAADPPLNLASDADPRDKASFLRSKETRWGNAIR